MKKRVQGTFGLKVIFALTFLAALVIVSRLFYIQIVEGKEYSERAAAQYIRPIHQLFNRGDIYMLSLDGDTRSVAMVETTYVLYLNPQVLSNAEEVYGELSDIIDIDRERFFRSAAKKNDPYEILKRGVTKSANEEIQALDLVGVGTHEERKRHYPFGSLASQVVGFMSYDGDDLVGMYGIEREFEGVLVDPVSNEHVNIFAEVLLHNNKTRTVDNEGKDGPSDVVLTLEPSVQIYVEKQLEDYMRKYGADRAGGIIMDPNTGAIVSMASTPSFDLNNFSNSDPAYFSNPNVSSVYEMGSIIKALTMAAGLDSGAITPESTFNDKGFIEADGARITNVYKGARGITPMQGILSHSMNTGVSWIVSQMGKEKFADYFYDFGLSEKTGINLPNEASGLLDNLESPRTVEYYTASFGQGMATTPIATIRALASIANGGLLVEPFVVKEVRHPDGSVEAPERPEPKRVIEEETSMQVSRMLVNLVDDTLEVIMDGNQSIPTHTVAAKTGTAQISDPQTGRYSEDEFFHSFFGYFPAYDPQFIVLLWGERPQTSGYASQTLTEPFFRITNFLIDYYAIKPDR